jgi:hypothetical protein
MIDNIREKIRDARWTLHGGATSLYLGEAEYKALKVYVAQHSEDGSLAWALEKAPKLFDVSLFEGLDVFQVKCPSHLRVV